METITQDNGARQYNSIKAKYPSVTTILTATQSKEERAKLRRWMHKMDRVHGNNAANDYRADRAQEGKDIHAAIAEYLEGSGELPDSPFTFQAQPFLKMFRKFNQGVEKFVSYPHPNGYAGTLDLITPHDGKLTVFDWTTSKRPKIKDWVKRKFLQTTAYADAYQAMTGEKPEQVGVIVLTPNRCQVFTASPEDFRDEWETRLDKFYRNEIWKELGLDIG